MRTRAHWWLAALAVAALPLAACDDGADEGDADEADLDEPADAAGDEDEPDDAEPDDEVLGGDAPGEATEAPGPEGEAPDQDAPAEPEELAIGSAEVGFEILAPGDWQEMDPDEFGYEPREDLPQATSFAFFVNPAGCTPEFCANINVFTEPTFGLGLDDYTRQSLAATAEQGGEIFEEGETELGGQAAYEAHYQVPDGMELLRRWAVLDDEEALVFTFAAQSENFDAFVDDARAFLDSVELLD